MTDRAVLPAGRRRHEADHRLQLGRIARRIKATDGANSATATTSSDEIAARCKEVESGARNIENILNRTILPEVSAQILARLADGGEVGEVRVGMGEGGTFRYDIG